MAAAVTDLTAAEQRAFFAGVLKMIRVLQDQGLIPVSGMCVTCTHFRPNVRRGPAPHHCALVDAPLANDQVRLDCPEHELAGVSAAMSPAGKAELCSEKESNIMSMIPGYTYGTSAVAKSPVTSTDFEQIGVDPVSWTVERLGD
jgi:hypothetical protein